MKFWAVIIEDAWLKMGSGIERRCMEEDEEAKLWFLELRRSLMAAYKNGWR